MNRDGEIEEEYHIGGGLAEVPMKDVGDNGCGSSSDSVGVAGKNATDKYGSSSIDPSSEAHPLKDATGNEASAGEECEIT